MSGGEIDLKINDELHRTLKRGFRSFKYCLPARQFNTKNDKLQLESSSSSSVSIAKVTINGKQVLSGKIKDKSRFRINGGQNRCQNQAMTTSRIIIQNGRVISSECQGKCIFISSLCKNDFCKKLT